MFISTIHWRMVRLGRLLAAGALLAGVAACDNTGSTSTSFNASNSPLATNVVSNSGLESSATELTGWSAYTSEGTEAAATFTVDSTDAYRGNNAFKASITALGEQPYDIEAGPVGVPVTAGQSYYLVGWVKGSAGSVANFTASLAEAPYTTFGNSQMTLSGDWEEVAFTFTLPEDLAVSTIRLPVQMNFEGNVGAEILIDDLQLVSFIPPDELPDDVVVNGSLEESDTDFTGWGGNPGEGAFSVLTTDAYEGNNSFLVEFGTIADGADPWTVEGGPQNVPVVEGVTYTFSAWIKGTDGGFANFGVQLQGAPYHTFASQTVEVSSEWQQVTFPATIVEASEIDGYDGPTTQVRLFAQMGYPENSGGEIQIDYVRLLTPNAEKVTNGGLEESDTDYPGWGGGANDQAPDTTLAVTSEDAHSGSNSFKVSFGTLVAEPDPWSVEAGPNNVPVVEGVTYTYSAWVKGTNGATLNINVQLQGAPYAAFASQLVTVTSDWQQVTFDATIADPSTIEGYDGPTEAIRLYAQMGYVENSGAEIYFDDVSFVPK